MTQPPAYSSIITPKHFVGILVGLWLFFTALFGFFSDWIFDSFMGDYKTDPWDDITYAGLFAFFLISLFGLTWKPLNKLFPLTNTKNLLYHALVQILNFGFGFTIGFVITQYLHENLFHQGDMYEKTEATLAIIAMMCVIGMLTTTGIFYTSAYLRQSLEADKRRSESELSALRAQINPHFLFNSLNSIAALIRISPEEAESFTEDLADVFRYTLRASDHPLVCLRDELEIIRLYLNIEQARFKERLTVNINVPDKLNDTPVPVLTLQPLVENAIKHGVSKKEGNHTVDLTISSNSKRLQIEVRDTGPGFPHHDFNRLMQGGTGLSNVFKRLQLHFGDNVDGAVADHSLIIRFPVAEELADHTHFEIRKKQQIHESISG